VLLTAAIVFIKCKEWLVDNRKENYKTKNGNVRMADEAPLLVFLLFS